MSQGAVTTDDRHVDRRNREKRGDEDNEQRGLEMQVHFFFSFHTLLNITCK